MVSQPPQTAWSFDSYAGLHSFHTSSCPDLPQVSCPRVVNARTTANCQPGCILQLTNGHTSGLETGSATFLHCFLRHSFVGDWVHTWFELQAGCRQIGWVASRTTSAPPRGPDTQECLCMGLCQKHTHSWDGLQALDARGGNFRTLPHSGVLRPYVYESHLILMCCS